MAQYTILYAPEKRFRIELPAGYDIVSVDGQGAFRYRVETIDHQPVLIGETEFGMHDRYEISMRLKRALAPSDSRGGRGSRGRTRSGRFHDESL